MVLKGAAENTPLLPNVVQVDANEYPSHELIGYALMLVSTIFFSFLWLATRFVTGYHSMPVASLLLLRGVTQVALGLISTLFLLDIRTVFVLSPHLSRMVLLRGILGSFALSLNFKGISILPLGIASTIFFLNPVFTILLSHAFLGETMGRMEIIATIASFTGVVLVADPFHITQELSFWKYMLGIGSVLLSALFAAATYTTLRSIAAQISFMTSVLSFGSCVIVLSLSMGGASLEEFTKDKYVTGVALLGCLSGFFGQCCLSKGYAYCRAGTGSLMRNLDLPIVYLLGLIFLGEVPRFLSLFGSLLVIGGSVILGLEALQAQQITEGSTS